jgi:hypothetical protein
MWWVLGAVANLGIAVSYVGISLAIAIPLIRDHQLRANRLGTATAVIFMTCAVHHGGHAVKAVIPFLNIWHNLGISTATGLYTRLAWDPQAVVWDVVSLLVAIYYFSLRRTYAPLMHGAKLFEDLRERQRQALEINDNIVQGLAQAQLALHLGDDTESEEAIAGTLAAARHIITDLLRQSGSDGMQFAAGDLRRSVPATLHTG